MAVKTFTWTFIIMAKDTIKHFYYANLRQDSGRKETSGGEFTARNSIQWTLKQG